VSVLDIAGRREVVLQDQDADDCFPAVLAWIQSEVRVRLGRLIDAVGPDRMISCNTDGLFCEVRRGDAPLAGFGDLEPLAFREKARHAWLDVISPQHVIKPDGHRLSGVPASATEIGYRQYSWLTWPRLPSQIAEGDDRGYVRTRRSVDLSKVPVNRWRWTDGLCLPVTTELGEDGETRIVPPAWWVPQGTDAVMTEHQHPVLLAALRQER
jgi:hypothetical protein